MEYWKIFSEETVVANLQGEDMDSVLDELLGVMTKAKSLAPRVSKGIREVLTKKVEQGATGAIGHGVAVPHVKLPQVKTTMAVLGRTQHSVDFRAGDGAPVNLFFLVVGPEEAPETHLNFMRWIAGICRNPDFRRFAIGCSGERQILDLLKEMGET
ncbi:MAG: PTS sugar transporter subunit IIA [Planctomycetota bacterium]